MFKRPCDKTSRTKPQRFWDALGPFPRSVWIHPCTPEDSLDRACGKVLKRSVLASKGFWPHLPENAHVFAEDGNIQSYRGHYGSLSTQSAWHQKLDKVMIMTQHNMTQTPLQGHVDATCPCFPDDRCRHGHEPDKTIEIISQEEADRDKTEEFLEEILPKQATGKADIPEGPSDEDFPPLPPPASPRVDRPPQQAPVSKSCSYKATVLKGKPNIQLHGGKPQRAQKLNQKEHPRVSAKTTPKIEAQTAQGFIDQPSSPQTESACREKVILEEQSSLPRCSHLPVFADFQMADEQIIPKDHTFKGQKVETWSWAGVQMVPTWHRPGLAAVLGVCRMQLAFLTMPNTIYTTRMPLLQRQRPQVQALTCQCQKIWTGSRLGTAVEGVPYKTPSSLQERVMARGHCRPTVSCGSLHLRYTPNVDPLHMVVNPLFSSNFLPPPGFGMNPYYIVGDFSLWPYQHGNYVNFPDNVNPSAADRQHFTCPANVPPGFTSADAFTLF